MTSPTTEASPSSASDPLPELALGLRLTRLRALNFRKIERADLAIPERAQFVCLVGPNGGGKSSIMSLLVDSLLSTSAESIPGSGYPGLKAEGVPRARMTGEIGDSGRLCAIGIDWTAGERTASRKIVLGNPAIRPPEGEDDALREAASFLGVAPKAISPTVLALWNWEGGPNRFHPGNIDAVAERVLLERPASRFETPGYEEPRDLHYDATIGAYWSGDRLMPVRFAVGVPWLERLVIDLMFDAALDGRTGDALVTPDLARIGQAVECLSGKDANWHVDQWPYRRVGVGEARTLSLLSAGELDVIVTVGLIVGSQRYLARKHRRNEDDPHADGVVFIDEIDAHLHPAWQGKVIPLLARLFPTIQFIVTTHSPFVLRSLPQDRSFVVRLPDARVFREDFSSWTADEILSAVFDAPASFSPALNGLLQRFRALCREPASRSGAIALYQDLANRSPPLRTACDEIIASVGDVELRDALAQPGAGG